MKTLCRLVIMLSALAGLAAAALVWGPPDKVQPIARGAIELVDELSVELIGETKRSSQSPHWLGEAEPFQPEIARLRTKPAEEPVATSPTLHSQPLTSPPASAENEQQRLISRLEALGAVDPRIDPWGWDKTHHRFSCRVPLAEHGAFTRQFEAIDTDLITAIRQVLTEVEAWHISRTRLASSR